MKFVGTHDKNDQTTLLYHNNLANNRIFCGDKDITWKCIQNQICLKKIESKWSRDLLGTENELEDASEVNKIKVL